MKADNLFHNKVRPQNYSDLYTPNIGRIYFTEIRYFSMYERDTERKQQKH